MPDESVKVAVRVRPFNQRETDRKAKCVIQMTGQMTLISNPDAPGEAPKKFTFDHSYWSHDGYTVDADGIYETQGHSPYASQRIVFNDLGKSVLNNAFEGYNCSLFAYGQTGSGKSYSMVGYGKNKGIVPIICEELFKTMKHNGDSNVRYTVTFSMLEIYNEQVRDLLSKEQNKGGLQVRQNPAQGLFYVQDLKKVPVGSYEEIEKRMEQGTASRTIGSTNMNATSSRAHTVVTITFDQIVKTASGETKKSSVMNLVDLAGSERADATGATGDRLKEGANINRSLSALGNVIAALADLSTGKKKVVVPYRDSVLTKLLQNALGGNSKTVMIAALSPADINYDETLSTLRYADRAKQIKNKAVVNESPLDKLIRQLREENERLKLALESGGLMTQTQGLSPKEIEKMRKEMEANIRAQISTNQELMNQESEADWDKKLQLARSETVMEERMDQRASVPHLANLNEDPMLSNVVFHYLPEGTITFGRKDSKPPPTVCLSGLSINQKHAVISNEGGEIILRPGEPGSKIKVNGLPLSSAHVLQHKDRILFGSSHVYVFINPQNKTEDSELPDEITWDFAQKEIAQAKGYQVGGNISKDQQIAQEQVLEILPMVSEVNAVSEELNKYRYFEVVLISASAQEGPFGIQKGVKVMVKMKNLLNGNTWVWERGKFMNRRYLIQDMYQRYLDGEEDVTKIAKEDDPFWEPTEDVLIGTANVFLQSLAYGLDFEDKLAITDYKGVEEGTISVKVIPCSQTGMPLGEEMFVDNPEELIGKPFCFKVTIDRVEVAKPRFSHGIHVKYRMFKDEVYTQTPIKKGTLQPVFKHTKVFTFNDLSEKHLDFFETGNITFLVYGVQEDKETDNKKRRMSTRELRQINETLMPMVQRQQTKFHLDSNETSQVKSELLLLQKKHQRLEQKEKRMQEICREWDSRPPNEQEYEPFYRAVSAVAFSSGTKFKSRVQTLNKTKQPEADTVSVYVFGEDEVRMEREALNNGGYISPENIARHYGKKEAYNLLAAHKRAESYASRTEANCTSVNNNGSVKHTHKREGSRACNIQ